MADLIVKVDTAVVVPVNIMPLLDDTDFKTIETAVVYNSAGLALTWNFVTPAGATSGTAVTPTTGGSYDWSEPIADKGMYAIEIPASGGASINNDTEGVGWFTGVATGVLPWRGPTIQFSPANVVDSLVSGSDLLDTNATKIGGTAQTGRDLGASVLVGDKTGFQLAAVASAALTEGYPTLNGTGTLNHMLYAILQHLEEASISGTTKTVKKRDASTTAETLTLNDSSNPTSITRAT